MKDLRPKVEALVAWTQALVDRVMAYPVVAFAMRVLNAYNRHQCPMLAASICYFAFFALFPLILGTIALASAFIDPAKASAMVLRYAQQAMPGQSDFLAGTVQGIIAARGALGAFAAITLLWSAKNIFQTLALSLELVWGLPRPQTWQQNVRQNLVALVLAVAIGGGVLAVTGGFWIVHLVETAHFHLLGLSPGKVPQAVWIGGANVLPVVLIFLALVVLYRVLPLTPVCWPMVLLAAGVSALVDEAIRRGFGWYLDHFARLNLVYGSVSGVIAFLLFIYFLAQVFLLAAEVADASFRRPARSTSAPPAPEIWGPASER